MADRRGTGSACPRQPAVCCLPSSVLCRLVSHTARCA